MYQKFKSVDEKTLKHVIDLINGNDLPDYIDLKPKKIMIGTLLNKNHYDQIISACIENNLKPGTVHLNMVIYNQENTLNEYITELNKIKKTNK